MNETNNSYSYDNSEYVNAGIMQLRLDSEKVLERLRLFLEGVRLIVEIDDNGNQQLNKEQVSKPKANKEGINSLMSFLETKINPQVVQGFFPSNAKGESEEYRNYICNVHDDLIDTLWTNNYVWKIKDEDLGLICDTMMGLIEPFMTRLIGDGERKSYANTMKVSEN